MRNGSTRLALTALVAASFSVVVNAPITVSATTGVSTVATSGSGQAFQRSAQDKVAYLHDGSLLVGYSDSNTPFGAYINQVTNPSTSPVSTNVLYISGGDEVSIYTVPGGSSTEIWIQVGSELDGLPKLEQVEHGTYDSGGFHWDIGAPFPIPGALTTGRQDPSLTWNGTYLIATWWDDTIGGNSDNIFYNWTTDKTGAGGWAVSGKSGTVNAALAIKSGTTATTLTIKSGTTGATTLAGVNAITYNTLGVAPASGDLFELGNGTSNSEIAQVASVVGTASPYAVTFTAMLTKGHTMGEVDTTATVITYNAGTGGPPAIGDLFEFGNGTGTSETRTVTAVSGAAPYVLSVAAFTNGHSSGENDTTATRVTYNAGTGGAPAVGDRFQIGKGNNCPCDAELRQVTAVAGTGPYILSVAPLSNAHLSGEEVRIEARELTATIPNSVQVSIRHSAKLGATIAVYGAHCRILTRTLLDSKADPSSANWTSEATVDSTDDCENNFGGPQIAIDENNGNIHVFKAVTNSQGDTSWGVTYWLGHMSGDGTISWNPRVVIDSTATTLDPPDIAGAVDSTGKLYIFWATSITNGTIKFVTLVSPYGAANVSAATTVPTTGTNPRYPHVPAQAPLTGNYVPLFYQSGTSNISSTTGNGTCTTTCSIILDTRFPDTTPPSTPAGLAAIFKQTPEVDLSWNASTDNVGVTGYTVYRDGTKLDNVSGSTLTYVDKTIAVPAHYSYTVDAFDAAGNHSVPSAAATVSTVDTTPPSVPTGLTATATPTPEVDLSWTPSTDNVAVTGYTIYRNGSQLTIVSGSTTTYADKAVVQGGSYSYTVDAFDAAGNHSAQSAPATTNTPDTTPPSVPTGLAATTTTKPSVTLTWVASTDNVGVTGYTVYRNGTKLNTAGATTLTYTDNAVVQLTSYSYTVDAFDAAGNHSAQSAPLSVNTPDSTPPSVPTGLTATFVASTPQVNLAWNASTDNVGVAGYTIYRNGSVLTTVSGSTTTYSDSAIVVSATYAYTVDAFDAAGNHSAQSTSAAVNPGVYTAMAPKRLLDTRTNSGKLGPGGSMNLAIAGANGVPTNASAVILNVTAVDESTAGFFTIYPTGANLPTASNLNWVAGETVPTLVSVGLGTGGKVTIYNGLGMADAIVDLEGYFAPSGGGSAGQFVPVVPARITDTRAASGQPNHGLTLGPGVTLQVQVTGVGGIPASGVTAVVLNTTVTDTTTPGFLTVFPTGASSVPVASNLNWMAGVTVPNRVIVPIGTGGQVSFFNGLGAADVIVDVNGYFTDSSGTGASFVPLTPSRIVDTRIGGSPIGGPGTMLVTVAGKGGVPASGAKAVVLNVTVVNPTTASALTVWPADASQPTSSDLNFTAGQTVPNLVVVKLSANGQIDIFNAFGTTNVIVDVVGWYG